MATLSTQVEKILGRILGKDSVRFCGILLGRVLENSGMDSGKDSGKDSGEDYGGDSGRDSGEDLTFGYHSATELLFPDPKGGSGAGVKGPCGDSLWTPFF